MLNTGYVERNILRTVNRTKVKRIGHSWRRNCLLKHVIEGKIEGRIEVTGRLGRRREQLLDDVKETRGCWKLKEEALDRTVWRNGFRKRLGTCRKADCRRNEREEG